jgi:hypothetical protein
VEELVEAARCNARLQLAKTDENHARCDENGGGASGEIA